MDASLKKIGIERLVAAASTASHDGRKGCLGRDAARRIV